MRICGQIELAVASLFQFRVDHELDGAVRNAESPRKEASVQTSDTFVPISFAEGVLDSATPSVTHTRYLMMESRYIYYI